MNDDAGGKSALSEGLGLAPERAGQPRMMTIIDAAEDTETGHWYSPSAVRDLLDAERARQRTEIEQLRAAAKLARHALSELIATNDPRVYSDALRALDEALADEAHR